MVQADDPYLYMLGALLYPYRQAKGAKGVRRAALRAYYINNMVGGFVDFYHDGKMAANFEVPAIRMHYEWGKNLVTGKIVLLECIQGVYDGN